MNKRPSEIKREARIALGGYWNIITVTSFMLVMSWFLSFLLVSRFFSSAARSTFALVSAVAVALILKLLIYLVRAGMTRVALRIARDQKLVPRDIVYAFKDQPDRYLVVGVIFTILEMLFALPELFYLFFAGVDSVFKLVLVIVWAILGIVFLIGIQLAYGFAFAVLLDDPACSAFDAIKKSAALTRGRRGRLLLLRLSFLGWIFPALLSSLIGLVWILPYYEEANMLFYLESTRDESL